MLFRIERKRPDDRILCLSFGTSVYDSFALFPILDVAVNERVTASIAKWKETLKRRDLTVICLFQPLTLEKFGGIGSLTANFLSTLVTYLAEV